MPSSKTKNNRKTRKMKGGYWCMFERYDLNDPLSHNTFCEPRPIKYSRRYYFHYNLNTLFAYKPHVFKHFDELNPQLIPNIDILNPIDSDGNYYMPVSNSDPPGNLGYFIDEMNHFIDRNRLSYDKLLNTIKDTLIDKTNKSHIVDTDGTMIEIWWILKPDKPMLIPRSLSDQGMDQATYNNIRNSLQITHIHTFKKHAIRTFYDWYMLDNDRKGPFYHSNEYSKLKIPDNINQTLLTRQDSDITDSIMNNPNVRPRDLRNTVTRRRTARFRELPEYIST